MRNICSKFLRLLAVVLATGLGISSHAQVQLVWTVGLDDNGWPVGDGGGPNTSFVQETGAINPLPGSPTSPEVNQQADNDYYFAGVYSTVIAGNGAYVPVGVVAANEEAAERAFAAADNDLRYHFNLPNSLRPFDLLSVTFDALNLDDPTAVNTDRRYGIEVYFNGVLVQTQIVIRPAQLGIDYTTPQFSLASVNAQVGPGFDNIVSLRGINYNAEGGGNWMGIDYVRLDAAPGPGVLPNVLNIGQNKVGSVTNHGNGAFTIVGGGNDIWDQRDEFTYAYTEVTGDFDVQVRVASLTASANWPKAGIMARESLSEYSRMAFARVTSDQPPGVNDVRFAYRTGLDNVNGASGGQHEDGGGNPSGIPNAWLRLARIGNTMYMSNSADGIAWNLVSSQDTTAWGGGALSNKLFVGLGVSRHPSATTPTVTAEFLNFQFNSNSAPFAVVAAESRGNPNGVRVIFNNPVGTGGQTPGNYTLTTVSGPNVTTVTGVRFTTANDSPNRDPLTYTLEGATGDPAVGGWELIASGDTGLATDPGRNTVGPTVNFANAKEYRAYRVLFPTVRDAATANSMQISEIELLDAGGADVTAPGDAVVGVRAIAGSSVSEVAVAGGSGNTFPANENPANAIDNATGTKYLNFAKLNTGIIVTPSGGAQPANPSVSAAGAGPNDPTIQLATSQLVEGATYELLVDSTVLAADGTSLVSAVATFTHGAGYEPRRIQVTHNKTDDHGYYQVSDAVAKGIGDVIMLGGGVFSPVETNGVFEDPVPDSGSNERFSSRISGVLVAPTTGNYIFYWSSDDNGHLYLSSDASPANKVLIASEPAWNGRREYINGGNQATRGTPPANISVPIALTAGKQYYLEGIATEGGGGNNSSATWLPPGGPAVVNGTSPIADTNFVPSRLFDGNTFNTLGPVRIISQPTNLTVVALTPATFRVALDGTPGYIYQWRRNGVPIPGANGPTYTITAAQLGDDQAVFSAVVANEFSSAVSGSATLTVLVPTPPHLLSANADVTFSNVVVHFDNRLEVASAQNIANYTLTNAAGPLTIISATRAANFRDVVLRIATTMPEDTPHTLIVRDIHDETGTTTLQSNPTNTTFLSFAFAPGYVQRQQHLGPTADYGAGSVDQYITDFRAGAAILRGECLANTFEYNQSDIGLPGFPGRPNNYGGRIAGYFTPPVNGDYTFYIAADDFARLLLSTDANPANVVVVAREPVWSARRTWTGEASGGGRGTPPANIYTATGLVGGQRYFMEAFFTEGGGGDNLGVDVQGPGDPVPNIGDAPRGGASFGTYVQPGNLAITTQPQNQMKTENAFATFTVVATSSSTICGGDTIGYQWRSNGVPILSANASSLTIGPVSLVNSGDVYSVIVTAPARSVTSANALLSVTADHVPPVLLSVRGNGCNDGSSTRIFLNWNELIAANPAEEEGSYRVFAPGLSEIAVSLATLVNGSNVVLDLATPMVGGGVYSVEAGFQTDLAGNQTDKVGSPTVDVAHGVVSLVGFSLGFGTNASGQIVIEAENYNGIDSPVGTSSWLLGTTPIGNGSISGNYMYSSPDAGVSIAAPPLNGFAPRLDYCVNLPAAGTWYVWARGCGIDGAANSVHMGIDGTDSPNGLQLGNFNALWDGNTWNWSSDTTVSPAQFSVASAGTHTFNIWMREDGVRVDRFLLTQDPAFTFPNRTVIGPAETPIGGGGSRPVLTISRSGGQITLTWSGTFCLQEADTVTGPWVTSARVNGTPFTPPTTGNKFYRLIDVCP